MTQHAHETAVELVSDATGNSPDAVQAFCVAHARLELLTLPLTVPALNDLGFELPIARLELHAARRDLQLELLIRCRESRLRALADTDVGHDDQALARPRTRGSGLEPYFDVALTVRDQADLATRVRLALGAFHVLTQPICIRRADKHGKRLTEHRARAAQQTQRGGIGEYDQTRNVDS